MSSTNDTSSDHVGQEQQGSVQEQQHAGNSGEGAASALAHLKTQTKQHRRHVGDAEDPSGGSSQ